MKSKTSYNTGTMCAVF